MPHRGISRTVHSVKWQKLFGRVKQRPRQAKQWNLFQWKSAGQQKQKIRHTENNSLNHDIVELYTNVVHSTAAAHHQYKVVW